MVVDTTVINGQVVTPGGVITGGIAIEGDRIVAVGLDAALPESRRTIDAKGRYVIPGLIDAHVHIGPGSNDWPLTARDFRTESRAAAYGGVTTALVFLFSLDSYLPIFDDLIRYGEENSVIDFSYHAGINNPAQIAEIPALVDLGITSFKHFFTAYRGEGGGTIEAMDPGLLFQSFKMIGTVGKGALGQVHSEDIDIILHLQAELHASGRTDLEAWSLARPPLVEEIAIDQIATIARDAKSRAYIVHLSSAAGLAAVERARRAGIDMIAETCPQYLSLDQTMEAEIGCWGKVNSAIHTIADQDALWKGLRNGSVTTMGTDHVPVPLATKENNGGKFGNIWNASPGISNGMEHLLTVMLSTGVAAGRIGMQELVRVTSENTAKVFGLYPRKGALQPGSDADLVIVDPAAEGRIGEDFFHGIAREWSPYFGLSIHGRPVLTMVRGTVVMEDGQLVDDTSRGRFQRRPVA